MSDHLSYEEHGGVAVVHMDDGKANALSDGMMAALSEALDRAEADQRAVVLLGREGRFCAGFDLKAMMAGMDSARALVSTGAALFMRIYEFPRPVVCACTGHAMAGGALLLCVGDTRIGARGEFKIGLNEVSIHMTLPLLAQELARDRLDPRHLTEATVQARIYAPDEAVEAGYLDRVVDLGEVRNAALEEAARLAELPPAPYAATKRRLRRRTITYIRETLEADMTELTGPA